MKIAVTIFWILIFVGGAWIDIKTAPPTPNQLKKREEQFKAREEQLLKEFDGWKAIERRQDVTFEQWRAYFRR